MALVGGKKRTLLANGMVHKLGEELRNDGAFSFGFIFLSYLDIGGEYFCLLFLFIDFYVYFILLFCFGCTILKNNSVTSDFVKAYPHCSMQCLKLWP